VPAFLHASVAKSAVLNLDELILNKRTVMVLKKAVELAARKPLSAGKDHFLIL